MDGTGHHVEQIGKIAERFRESFRLVAFRSPPQHDALARELKAAGNLRDPAVLRGHVVKRATVAIDLLVDVRAVLEHPPGIVIDDVGQ